MKEIICWNCGEPFGARQKDRERCPKCQSKWWKAPTFNQKFVRGIHWFKKGYNIEPWGKKIRTRKPNRNAVIATVKADNPE